MKHIGALTNRFSLFLVILAVTIGVVVIVIRMNKQDLSDAASIPPLYSGMTWQRSEKTHLGNLAKRKENDISEIIYIATSSDEIKKQQAQEIKSYYETELTKRGWFYYPYKYVTDNGKFTVDYVKPEYPLLCPMHFILQSWLPCPGEVRVFHISFSGFKDTNVSLQIGFTEE